MEVLCEFENVTGDCAIDSSGTIHVFVAFAGGSCDQEPLINYAFGGGDKWRSLSTPYRGWVLGVAVSDDQPFLLFVNSSGVHIGKVDDLQFAPSVTVSSQSADWKFSTGDLVAKNGTWWAIWSERAAPSQPFQMFQASTMTSATGLPQPVGSALPHVLSNAAPSLALDPADPDSAVLAWMVVLEDFSAVVRLARAHSSDAVWHEQAWAPPSPQPSRDIGGPDLSASDGHLYGAYVDNDTITYTLDPPDGTTTTSFQGDGNAPRVAATGGRTFVAWQDANSQVVLGEPPAVGSVPLGFSPSGNTERLIGLVAYQGQVTVLAVTFADKSLLAGFP
jgi:hypothetical protein